jgi:hypothetical protein
VRKRLYEKNKVLLAAAIPLSRPALYRLFERPDHPRVVPGKGYNIDQWRRYSDENIATWNRREPSKRNGSTNPRDAAFIARQQIEAEKAQFDLDVKRGKYELKAVMAERVMTNFGQYFRDLDKALKHELPPRLEGLSAGQIVKMLGGRADELRERAEKSISNGISKVA